MALPASVPACAAGGGQVDRDLRILDPARGAGVRALHPGRARALLQLPVSSTTSTASASPRCSVT